MSRIKAILLGMLAVLAASSMVSATASAEVNGPWWRHLNANNEQVLYPTNVEQTITSENQSPFILKGEVGATKITLECTTVKNTGNIWNGAHQGEDEATVKFTNCSMVAPLKCAITVGETKVFTELMWKYGGNPTELTESPKTTQQKIYDVFAPNSALKEKKPGEFRSVFVVIKLPTPACGVLAGSFNVESAGPKATFVDQENVSHEVVWGTAAEVAPQNQDVQAGELVWRDPNVTRLHHQEKEINARLIFDEKPAELQGQIKVERGGEKFGAFNE